jgi:type I restriction enzyme, S subunit
MKTESAIEGWECKNLGSFISENKKSGVQVQDANDFDEYSFFTSGEKILRYKDWLIDGENIFMSTGGVANVQYNKGKCSYSTDTYCFKSKINPKFLYYYLWNIISKINYSYFQGTGLKHLQKPMLKDHELLFPKKPEEQEKIAEVLTTVDNAIDKTRELIQKDTRIKNGLVQDLFDVIIKETKPIQIKTFAKVKGGKRMPKGSDFSESPTLYPYLRVTDFESETVNDSDLKFVKKEDEKLISNYKISSNDVYITIAGTIGLVGTVPEKLNNSQLTENAAKITNFNLKEIYNRYLSRFMNYYYVQNQIWKEIGTGGGVPKLAIYRIENLFVSMPKRTIQEDVVNKIDSVRHKIQSEQDSLNKLIKIKKGLMQDLLTGKTRVKV